MNYRFPGDARTGQLTNADTKRANCISTLKPHFVREAFGGSFNFRYIRAVGWVVSRLKILFVELDMKAANCKPESCSLMHFHIQFDSRNKYLTFNLKFDNFVSCNKQTLQYNFGKLAKFDLSIV